MLRVLDLNGDRALQVDSASCLVERGTSGKVSKFFQGWCFLQSAKRHFADVLACGRHPEREFLRKTDRLAVLLGNGHKSASGFHLDRASPATSRDIQPSFQGCAHKTWTVLRERFGQRIHSSSASGCSLRGHQSQTSYRIVGNGDEQDRRPSSAATEILLCTRWNTISQSRGLLRTRSHKSHSVFGVSP